MSFIFDKHLYMSRLILWDTGFDIMDDYKGSVVCYLVRDISPYRDDVEKATQHVADAVGRSYAETALLIEEGKLRMCIDKDTDETWFEIKDGC